ncbi:MAG TPA: hypothetical protein VD908_13305, partial [Cytophagales bacterium]|nr:hypothetical protein [Cytophagales bacterium]
STIILSWHHALMDAHGAETFLKVLGEQISNPDLKNLLPRHEKDKKLLELLISAKKAKRFVVEETPKKIAALTSFNLLKNAKAKYKTIEFDEAETTKIESRTKELGLRFGLSPLYLGATCRTLYSILKKRNNFKGDLWVPVPQDHRLKGNYGPVITNQISFLFYKLSEKELTTLKTTIDAISSQMIFLIKEGVTKNYVDMMNLFKRIPLSIYSRMVKGPTKGLLSTFFFSDTGDSLRDFNTFLNLPILDATHFPPTVYPPGFTVVFMKFKGKLKLIIGYTDANFSEEEIGLITSTIKTELFESFA